MKQYTVECLWIFRGLRKARGPFVKQADQQRDFVNIWLQQISTGTYVEKTLTEYLRIRPRKLFMPNICLHSARELQLTLQRARTAERNDVLLLTS